MILIDLEDSLEIDKTFARNRFSFRKRKGTKAALHKIVRRHN